MIHHLCCVYMVPKKRTGFLYGIIGECNVVVFFSFNLLVQLENYIYHLETVIRNGSINNVLLIITAAILSLNKKYISGVRLI